MKAVWLEPTKTTELVPHAMKGAKNALEVETAHNVSEGFPMWEEPVRRTALEDASDAMKQTVLSVMNVGLAMFWAKKEPAKSVTANAAARVTLRIS